MNDTQNVKALSISTIGGTQLPGSALAFPRVASSNSENRRTNYQIGSLSPTSLGISHRPRSVSSPVQRTLAYIDQKLTRIDAQSNPIGNTTVRVALQCNIPSDVTLAEFRAAASLLLGFLLETDGANLTALYNGEF